MKLELATAKIMTTKIEVRAKSLLKSALKSSKPDAKPLSLHRMVRRLDIWMMGFYVVRWRGRWMAANYNQPPLPAPLAWIRFHFWHATMKFQPMWEWLNLKVMALADRLDAKPPNNRICDAGDKEWVSRETVK